MGRLLDGIEKRYAEAGLELNGDSFSFRQIKEKFGALRVYVTGSVDIEDLREIAERDSKRTCMSCGQPGEMVVTGPGWFHVVCNQHRQRGDMDPAEYLRRCEERERQRAQSRAQQPERERLRVKAKQ